MNNRSRLSASSKFNECIVFSFLALVASFGPAGCAKQPPPYLSELWVAGEPYHHCKDCGNIPRFIQVQCYDDWNFIALTQACSLNPASPCGIQVLRGRWHRTVDDQVFLNIDGKEEELSETFEVWGNQPFRRVYSMPPHFGPLSRDGS
jgi:hypothetical protein